MEAVSPLVVARQILWMRKQEDGTHMHVIKLVYLSHGCMLGLRYDPLVTDVRRGVDLRTRHSEYVLHVEGDRAEGQSSHRHPNMTEQLASQQQILLAEVVDAYHKYCALDRSVIAHQAERPGIADRLARGYRSRHTESNHSRLLPPSGRRA